MCVLFIGQYTKRTLKRNVYFEYSATHFKRQVDGRLKLDSQPSVSSVSRPPSKRGVDAGAGAETLVDCGQEWNASTPVRARGHRAEGGGRATWARQLRLLQDTRQVRRRGSLLLFVYRSGSSVVTTIVAPWSIGEIEMKCDGMVALGARGKFVTFYSGDSLLPTRTVTNRDPQTTCSHGRHATTFYTTARGISYVDQTAFTPACSETLKRMALGDAGQTPRHFAARATQRRLTDAQALRQIFSVVRRSEERILQYSRGAGYRHLTQMATGEASKHLQDPHPAICPATQDTLSPAPTLLPEPELSSVSAERREAGRSEESTDQRRNVRAEDPRGNTPTSGIVRRDSHVRKSGVAPAGNSTRVALGRLGGGGGVTAGMGHHDYSNPPFLKPLVKAKPLRCMESGGGE
ncbi:hypothetical protein PR048_007093 [Dryococelus australis]|uniref:Uncharacterized protein n=1 Tax=Dryococelus australis TaxID=614101 RepID=A0ABQ9ICN6_9NEOP|nr:hypothetical protein PR048_007093 [Dryococelus australis]